MALEREAVLATLKTIIDPQSGQDIIGAGLVRALRVDGDIVRFVMEVHPNSAAKFEHVRAEAQAKLEAMDGCDSAQIVLTAHSNEATKPSEPTPIRMPQAPRQTGPAKVPGIERIIAIASGKGGVGKSTIAANLACALAVEGRRTGLLDADVYGPSQPRMLGVSGRPSSPDGQIILPMRNHGVTVISIGLMANEDQAVVWRGPMLMGALQQMMTQVQWGALDVLLVDLPPGTGDVQMTLGQKFVVDGAIIVSTPQDIALLDARKGVDMFKQMKIPIVGMIENMSTHICSNCGHEEHLFGHGGVATEAAKHGVPLLAEIPLQLSIRTAADGGAPVVISHSGSREAEIFREIARQLVSGGLA